MSLFRTGRFILHSGQPTDFKIDCDFLTDEDYEACAFLGSKVVKFGHVVGVQASSDEGIDNGARFARAMLPYATTGPTLIVDDVLTTGQSMIETRAIYQNAIGLVIFTRRRPPDWIKALFWQLVNT